MYIFSEQDLNRSWQAFNELFQQDVVPRIKASIMGHYMQHKTPYDAFRYSPARLVVSAQSAEELRSGMLMGIERAVMEAVGPDNRRRNLAVYLRGQPVTGQAQNIARVGGGELYHSIYSDLARAVGGAQFNLYASREGHSAWGQEAITDYPDINLSARMLVGDRTELMREVARQTAPVYQIAYKYNAPNGGDPASVPSNLVAPIHAGMDPDEAKRLVRESYRYATGQEDDLPISLAAHEFAHTTLQPSRMVPHSVVQEYVQGKRSLADILTRGVLESQFLNEARADMFSMAISLNPQAMVRGRYAMGAYGKALSSRSGEMQGWKFGDPLNVRVIDPQMIESETSPLAQLVNRYATAVSDRILHNTARTGDLMADAAASAMDQQTVEKLRATMDPLNMVRNAKLDIYASAYFSRTIKRLSSDIMRPIIEDYRSGMLGNLHPDVEELIKYQGTRLWALGYMVGKSRPDLIGEQLSVTPDSVRVASTGEELNIAELLPSLNISSMYGPQVMHPVQMERGFKALEIYDRAREAIRQGVRLNLSPGTPAADVVSAWRDRFWKVMNDV
ncbi:MAG: hypothetical protein KatS3mg023_3941 [Armatimonadota bacterium]|nr:MAG: hypothetical protein KatS3mg023_3941 [Armatimonadota bacterium]